MIHRALPLLALLLAGCAAPAATGPGATTGPNASRPPWIDASPTDTPKHAFFVDSFSAASLSEAQQGALERALGQAAQRCGVRVQSTIKIVQREDLEHGYRAETTAQNDVAAVPIVLHRFSIDARHHETRHQGRDHRVDAWVCISVPQVELERTCREAQGRVAWRLRCGPDATCPAGLEQRVVSLANASGLRLLATPLLAAPLPDTPLEPDGATESLAALGRRLGVASLLEVDLIVERTSQDGAEHYAIARLEWKTRATDDGTLLRAVSIGPEKGGHYSRQDALRVVTDALMEALSERLATPTARITE